MKKRGQFKPVQSGATPEQTAVYAKNETAVTAPATVSSVAAPKKALATAAVPIHYEYIGGDLKRIGILTGVIILVLIVLFIIIK
jgi:hypothetical protein